MTELNRKTGKDYKKEYQAIISQKLKLEKEITNRINWLHEKCPDIKIYGYPKSIKVDFSNITIDDKINIINLYEKWLESKSPVKQGNLFEI